MKIGAKLKIFKIKIHPTTLDYSCTTQKISNEIVNILFFFFGIIQHLLDTFTSELPCNENEVLHKAKYLFYIFSQWYYNK